MSFAKITLVLKADEDLTVPSSRIFGETLDRTRKAAYFRRGLRLLNYLASPLQATCHLH